MGTALAALLAGVGWGGGCFESGLWTTFGDELEMKMGGNYAVTQSTWL